MQVPIPAISEKLQQEINLQERFSAAHGNPAVFPPVVAVALRPCQKSIRTAKVCAVGVPCVGIVTEPAPKVTALQENHESDSRPVHGTEGLDGMHSCLYHVSPFPAMKKRRGIFFLCDEIKDTTALGTIL